MLRWPNNQGVMGDDPPYLVVGTEVSAKYKGAFCEAKVRKVVRSVKCKVNFKVGGSAIVTDDQIRGTLRVGSVVEAKHPDRKEFVEACITKIQDCSQYTVVFDDGDITTLRRTALCLKSGRHFAESETLDQLPLTHPEHFGNPVVGSRRGGRRSRNPMSDESSEEEEEPRKGKSKEEKEADIGKVVCVELGDKKKQKDNWFPGLVVHPAAQEVVRIRVKDEYLVRSFKDGRYFTVPKKEASEFTREVGLKVDNNTLKTAVDKALQYLDKDELPPHWDRELLFGLDEASTASDSDAAFDSDSSDDEPREEKDHFVAQLYKFMDDSGTPINRGPAISGKDIDLYKLFKVVHKAGGCNRVTNHNQWKMVSHKLGFGQFSNTANLVKGAYKKYLQSFEEFYRKLGCTMVNHPRGNKVRHRGGRSLIRDKDRSTPVNVPQSDNKDKGSDTVDDDDEPSEKSEEGIELSADEKDEDILKRKEGRDVEVVTKLPLGPPPLERKPSDPQLKVNTPRGKPKRLTDTPGNKSGIDVKKKIVVPKVKRVLDDDEEEESDMLDVEDLDEDDEDKLTTTRSKSKEEFSKPKSEQKPCAEVEKKSRSTESVEKRIKPSLTATVEKKIGRPSLSTSDKKGKATQDGDRKTVRSLAAEFEKKGKGLDTDKKDMTTSDSDKKSRTYSVGENEKKIRPSLTATLERKKSSNDTEKKNRQSGADSEKKIRPSLTADPERKKVRPSLTADPTKKVSRIDSERKKERISRPSELDRDDSDRKTKVHDSDRKNNTSESSRLSSAGDSDRKSSKSDSGDSEKRGNSKSRRGDEDRRKQQVRKRKDNEDVGSSSVDDSLDLLPNYKNVCIGDKLKVYYGPTHESKVTYEAKVLEVEGEGQDETFLVHYTGWNNRYDEWIKRSRIADNLSWSPARGKRRHQTQLASVKKSSTKKRTLTPARDSASPLQKDQSLPSLPGVEKSRDSQPPRSSTPSSVTSSSSRTKSPAMRPGSARVTRNTIGDSSHQPAELMTRRTRTRRISGQTDIPSESDSDDSESESEAEPSSVRKSTRRTASERDEDSSRKDSSSKKKLKKRETDIEVDDEEDKEVEKDDLKDDVKDEDDVSSESPSEGKVPMKRTRKGTRSAVDRKNEVKVEPEEDEETPPIPLNKGRDFDLNQIRSELKGIDKAVKTSCTTDDDKDQAGSDTEPDPDIDLDTTNLLEEKASTLLEQEESATDMEDIYEFKEPEPFEFEARTKREPSVERTGKLQKRPLPRIFDDVAEPAAKKKVTKPNPSDTESSEDGGSPSKKRFRRPVVSGKKDEPEIKLEAKSPTNEASNDKIEPVTPQKKIFSTSSDDAFEKLRQSPSYRFSSGSPIRVPTPTPLCLSPVPVPLQSPPQLCSASSSVITTSTSIPSSRPPVLPSSSIIAVHSSTVTKIISTTQSKSTVAIPSSKTLAAPIPTQKILLPQESKSVAGVKPTPPTLSASASLSPSRPPVLAAAVKMPSEAGVITKTDDWLKSRQQPEKSEASKDEENTNIIKTERDDSIPPLVATVPHLPLAGRISPEPPQLLPMAVPASKLIQEPAKTETKDVPMPQIKKENLLEVIPVDISNPQPTAVPTRSKTPEIDEQLDNLTEDESPRKAGRRKTQLKRKKAVSKEFVEDSDSDSSDEERRLVIDKSESSDSCNEAIETKPQPPVRENELKWPGVIKVCLPGESNIEQQKTASPRKEDITVPKSKDQLSGNPSGDVTMDELSSVIKIEETEELEVDNNLCSLLCEETIPGSPAPPCEAPVDVHSEPNSSISSDRPLENTKASCKVLEMPFASVPGNTRSSGPSTSTNPTTTQFTKPSVLGEKIEHPVADLGLPKAGPSAPANEAAPVMDNTPPTTPDSSISTISNSPRGEHGDTLSILDNDSSKSHRDSEDAENKDNDFSDDDLDVGSRLKRMAALSEKKDNDRDKNRCDTDSVRMSPASNKKRRRSRKSSESEDRIKRPRHTASRLPNQGAGSDSDDGPENPVTVTPTSQGRSQSPSQSSTLQIASVSAQSVNSHSQSARSPRPSKYNFFVELAPELDASQRIALLQQTLQDLRKTYANVKQQLACIDRRRKKLRRREREARLEARKMMREERRQARDEVVSCS
ncbi:AT-rich interactive domain-containing protein 4B isoform X3 [Frankliniella occidentalis]|uniref:AT-rich interactive domain-containing protein 4B isoform X3 n=1 Tax=Frankliniella occidentalis TaxID=133901 RepID=A0A9C6XBY1_FRAOC|nr:AT-rich interactive domain-containing protein 4B isoform X3 [Frankliniella occidentalis]XP_052133477.1 AT-rich interactive domain-containing protein 4B isoform X3 [Frankliniella occidentalis]